MTELTKRLGQYFLVVFYVVVFIITCLEQVEYTNENCIALVLSIFGVIITCRWGFTQGLFFSLLAFPLGFEFVYFELITPRMPFFLIQLNKNTLLFSAIYAIFLLVLYLKKWDFLAFLTFLLGIFHVERQLPSQLISAISYQKKGQILPSPILNSLAQISKSEDSPIYLICLDGYPDLTLTHYAKISKADSLLKAFHFYPQKIVAKAFQTPISVRYLLTGKLYTQEFTNLNVGQMCEELSQSLLANSPRGYEIYLGSVLVNYNLSKPFFSVIEPIRPNKLMLKPLKRFFGPETKIGSSAAMESYHDKLISQIDGKGHQLKFLHFITFHGFSTDYRLFLRDIPIADRILIRILRQIQMKSPHAKVVIFSDHGERFTNGLDPHAAIFYLNF